MIERMFDQFTYSHFAYGILAYFWGISLKNFIIIHTIYELFEVTPIVNSIFRIFFLTSK